jgi:hypothetical protein
MTVFKLERERPAFDTQIAKCYYVKDRYLRLYEVRAEPYVLEFTRTFAHCTFALGSGNILSPVCRSFISNSFVLLFTASNPRSAQLITCT